MLNDTLDSFEQVPWINGKSLPRHRGRHPLTNKAAYLPTSSTKEKQVSDQNRSSSLTASFSSRLPSRSLIESRFHCWHAISYFVQKIQVYSNKNNTQETFISKFQSYHIVIFIKMTQVFLQTGFDLVSNERLILAVSS